MPNPRGEVLGTSVVRYLATRQEQAREVGQLLDRGLVANEHLVGTADGVFRSYTIKRQSVDAMWDGDLVKAMRGTLSSQTPRSPADIFRSGYRLTKLAAQKLAAQMVDIIPLETNNKCGVCASVARCSRSTATPTTARGAGTSAPT